MTIEQFNKYGADLESMLKLETMPIAFKFYEKVADVPKEALFPLEAFGKHMAVCQAFSFARMKGLTIAMTTKDHWCWNPLIGYGNVECIPGQPQFDEVCKYISIPDKEKAAKFFEKFPRVPLGKYEAIVVAPLVKASFEPDIVLIYAEAAKINHLIRCVKGATGNYITSVFDGIDSCIYCTVPSFLNNEYRVTFPDPGDRERARASDGEMILTVPAQRMDEFMESVYENDKMGFNSRMMEINLDYARPPFYNTLFEMWGLEQGDDWQIPQK